ncbi:MAG: ECF transporter S component [Clostridia bacterium]|nr:ECF transporter S component [Clostridia bacterium]
MKSEQNKLLKIVFAGVLAAMVYVVTLFRFPMLGSKVHFANAVCLLSGMLLGPVWGGVAAGLGSALYDAFGGGYDILNILITFVSKFAMAWVCGMLVRSTWEQEKPNVARTVLAAAAGALTYVALYMLKSLLMYGWAGMVSRFPASIINAAAAIVAAPIFYFALLPALRSAGILKHMRA